MVHQSCAQMIEQERRKEGPLYRENILTYNGKREKRRERERERKRERKKEREKEIER